MPRTVEKLIEGYKKFKQQYFGQDKTLFDGLTSNGQSPKILVVACSDSRVDPAIVTSAVPGDLFVIRNVANLIPPYEDEQNLSYHGTSAALEFAVCTLDVNHVIVFGHSQCGGINSLFKGFSDEGFISKWMGIAMSACDFVNQKYSDYDIAAKTDMCAQYSLINSLNNLKTFPWINSRLQSGNLKLHAWYFDIASGNVLQLNNENQFIELV